MALQAAADTGNMLNMVLSLDPTLDVAKMNVMLSTLKRSLGDLGKDIKLIDGKKLDEELGRVREATKKVAEQMGTAASGMESFNRQAGGLDKTTQTLLKMQASMYVFKEITESVNELTSAFVDYEYALAEVSAITGTEGEQLQKLGKDARELASIYGGSVRDQLMMYKGLLSKLGPEQAQNAEGMYRMVNAVNLLSKASGDDAASSMASIVDAGLQLGLLGFDAEKNAAAFEYLGNAMAGAAKAGSAEIPSLSVSLLDAGVAAKRANLDIVELLAGFEALGRGGKYAGEAGTAMRNVILYFQRADAVAEKGLVKIGTSSKELGTILNTQGLAPALDRLNEAMKNMNSEQEKSVLLTNLFGVYNVQGAGVLLNNVEALKKYKGEIQSIVDLGEASPDSMWSQASKRMNTERGAMERFSAHLEEIFITIGEKIPHGFTEISHASHNIYPILSSLYYLQHLKPLATIGASLSAGASAIGSAFTVINQSTGALELSFKSLGKTMLASPMFQAALVIGAVIAVQQGIKMLVNSMSGQVEERKKANEEEIKVNAAQIKSTQAQIANAVNTNALMNTYKNLASQSSRTAEEQGKLESAAVKLKAVFPNLKISVDDTKTTMEQLAGASAQAMKDLQELERTALNLKIDKVKLDVKSKAIDVDAAKKKLEDTFVDTTSGLGGMIAKGTDALFGTSTPRTIGESITKTFSGAVYAAKNSTELRKAQIDLMETLVSGKGLSASNAAIVKKLEPNVKQALLAQANEMIAARQQAIDAANNAPEEIKKVKTEQAVAGFEDLAKAGVSAADAIQMVAENTGLAAEEVRRAAFTKELKDASKNGEIAGTAVERIGKKYGYTKEQAMKVTGEEKLMTTEAKAAAAAVADIGNAFSEAKKAATESMNTQKEEMMKLMYDQEQVRKGKKKMTKEEQDALAASLAKSKEVFGQTVANVVGYQNIEFQAGKITEQFEAQAGKLKDSGKSAKTISDRMKTQYDLLVAQLDREHDRKRLLDEMFIINQGRKPLREEELQFAQEDLDLATKKFEKVKEAYAAANKRGMSKEDNDAWLTKIAEAEKAALESQKTFGSLRLDINTENAQRALATVKEYAEGAEQSWAAAVQSMNDWHDKGTISNEDYMAFLSSELGKIESELAKAGEQVIENEDKLMARRKTIEENIERFRNAQRDRELEREKKHQTSLLAIMSQQAENAKRVMERVLQINMDAAERVFALEQAAYMKRLDNAKEQGGMTELAYNEQKEKIEKDFTSRRLALQKYAEASRKFADEQAAIAALERERQQAEDRLKAAKMYGENSPQYLAAVAEMDDIVLKMQEKGDMLKIGMTGIGESMGAMFGGLIGASNEAAKDSMKETLVTITAYLEKLLAAAILEVVLKDATWKWAGPFAPLLAGISTGIVTAGLHSIIKPLLNGLTNFATGGVVNSPTLAVVGDAARLGGDNTEYVLRQKQLQAVVNAAANNSGNKTAQAIAGLAAEIGSMFGRMRASGRELVTTIEREQSFQSKRVISLTPISA